MANVDFKVKKGLVVSTTATILSTNNATSTSTGALIVSGGAGIGQNLYVGSNTNIAGIITATNTSNSTSTSSGALRVIGGVGIGGNLYVGGTTNISGIIAAINTTNSTSTTTGAITISGGLGVRQDVFIGGNLNIAGQILGSGISGTVDTATNIVVTNDASTNNDLYVTFVSTSSGSTGIKVDLDGIRYNPNQNSLKLLGSTSATSTTTGALQVTGGVGIGGDLWVGGAVFSPLGYIENSRTTGAVNTASWWLKCLTFSLPNIGDSTQFKFKSIIKYFNNVTYGDNSEQDVLWISAARDTASTIIGTFFWNNESSESAVSASSGNHILTYNTTTGVVEYWRRSTQIGGRAFVLIQEEVPASTDYKSVAPTVLTSENWVSTWTSLGSTLTIDDPDTTSWEDVTITGTLTHSGTLNHTGATANLTNATSAVTLNLATGATTTGTTKTINIGTAGVAGSTANINVGSSVADALGQLSIYSTSTKILATTPSTSTTTGALQVTGGVGIGGELWVNGLINGTLNGNAATASKWQTARTVTLSGDLGGEITIDGSQNVILTATIQADSVALGTDTTGIYIASGSVTGYGINGSANTEGSNFAISINSTSANTVSTIVFRDANGDFRSRNIVVEGTASSTSTVTGALQIVGGVGVGGNLYVGGTATIVGSIIGTVTTATNLAGGSTGAVPYQSSTGTTTFVAASTSGYVLTTQGAGAAPVWTSPAGLIAGNADKANQWTTARSITLAGDLSGIVTINGTQDVILTATIQADSVALGTDTTGIYVASGAVSGYGLSGSANTEGSTFTVASNATSSNVASTIVFRDASGNFSAGTITATATSANNLTGGAAGSLPYQSGVGTTTMLPIATTSNWVLLSSGSAPIWASPSSIVPDTAQKANQWTTARSITLAGDLSGVVSIDGSQNVTLTATIQADSVALGTDTTGIYVASGAVSGYGLSGSASTEGSTFTVTSNATSTNNASTIVFRDANGDFSARSVTLTGNLTVQGTTFTVNSTVTNVSDPIFVIGTGPAGADPTTDDNKDRGIAFKWHNGTSAKIGFFGFDDSSGKFTFIPDSTIANEVVSGTVGTIVANLEGSVIGTVTTATTANRWTTSRSITLSGDLGGVVSIDGSQNVILTATIQADSVELGTDTTGDYVATAGTLGYGLSGGAQGEGSDFNVESNATSSNVVSTIVFRDGSGNFSAGTITASLTGNATSADKWSTARTVTFTGDTTGTFSIDGSANVTNVNLTIQPNSVALGTDTTGIYVASGSVSGYGLSGTANTEGSTFTVTSNATSSNVVSTIVFRDANGDFRSRNIVVEGTTQSSATNTGALQVVGGAGIGKDLYVGGTIYGSLNGTVSTASNVAITNDTASATAQYITFVSGTSGNLPIKVNGSELVFVPSTGRIGIGLTSPQEKLDVNGIVVARGGVRAGANSATDPFYETTLEWGADAAGTWKTIVIATLTNITYSTQGFIIDIYDPLGNHAYNGTQDNIYLSTYYVAMVRTNDTVLDTPDACYVRGPGNLVQAVKTATGTYEVQVQNLAFYREKRIKISTYAKNGTHAIAYKDGATASVGIATYSATTSTTSYDLFQNIVVANQIRANSLDSVSNPGFTWSGDQNTGFFRPAADTIGIVTNGTEKVRVNSSGNVGVGITSPQSLLHVNGTVAYGSIRVTPTSANGESAIAFFTDTAGTDTNDAWVLGHAPWGNTGDFAIGNENNGAGGNVRLLIEKAGNVGVGTITPGYRLDVNNGVTSADSFQASFGSTYSAGFWSGIHFGYSEAANTSYRKSAIVFERQDGSARGKIHILNDGAADAGSAVLSDAKVTIQYDGNVGIGTTSTSAKLDVAGATVSNPQVILTRFAGDPNFSLVAFNGNTSTNATGSEAARFGLSYNISNSTNFAAGFSFIRGGGAPDGALSIITNATDRIRVTSAGNVGIGTTSPNALLQLGTSSSATEMLRLHVAYDTSRNDRGGIRWSDSTNITGRIATEYDGTMVSMVFGSLYNSGYNSNNLMTLRGSGNLGIGTITPDQLLHVYKTSNDALIKTETTAAGAYFLAQSATDGYAGMVLYGGGAEKFFVGSYGVDALQFKRSRSGAEFARIFSNGNVAINTTTDSSFKLEVNGSFAATTKSFVINHPTKPGMKLRYGSLEGPENGVYVRGKLQGTNVIELPDYWTKLVDPDSITVTLTPIGNHQNLYVEKIEDNKVFVKNSNFINKEIHCFYMINAERSDVEKLKVEI